MPAWRSWRCAPSAAACRVALCFAWRCSRFAIAASYGVFDEVHQLFVPGRSGDLYDWFADVSGARHRHRRVLAVGYHCVQDTGCNFRPIPLGNYTRCPFHET